MSPDFATRFSFDDDAQKSAQIRVIGVGGGGGNAVNNMLAKGIHGVEFVSVNTDAQALQVNLAPTKIQMGRALTNGLGAGARPSVGANAAQESQREIEAALEGCDMVFITAGMGGGTGTGAAPVVAQIAKGLGILTVAVITKPFGFEGPKRARTAAEGLQALRDVVDTLIVIPNESLLDVASEETSVSEAFEMADDVLYNATRGISDLITVHGLVNLDFADVRTTMSDGGTAIMGAATDEGDGRAERAARKAISSPLLDGISIHGARNVLVNLTAGPSLSIREAGAAVGVVQQEAGDSAEVIFGLVIDESMGTELRVTVIATGFDPADGTGPHDAAAAAGIRRTVTLGGRYGQPNYKGEDSLRSLDAPAFERRTSAAGPPERTRTDEEVAPDDDTARATPLRRLPAGDLDRRERIRKDDTDTPAFLRRMMD